MWLHSTLFTAKIGRVFTPDGGFPLQYWIGIFMSLEPGFGPVEEVEEFGVTGRFFEFCIGFFLLYPANGRPRIGIDGNVAVFLMQQRQRMNDGQEAPILLVPSR